MILQRLPDPIAVGREAVHVIQRSAAAAVAARGRCVIALSGGKTPLPMLDALSLADLPWPSVWVCQVDERCAPVGHSDRNLTVLQHRLVTQGRLPPDQLVSMPVDQPDLDTAAVTYEARLRALCGSPATLDLVQLGLGEDGHTASIFQADMSALLNTTRDVAATRAHNGYRRMTLTLPMLSRSREILWLIVGRSRGEVLTRLVAGDPEIPASHVRARDARILTDASTGAAD